MAKAGVEGEARGGFKFRYVLMLAALLLFILSLASHSASDLSILEGGSDAPLSNWIGPTGAHLSRLLLYLFGLATYPIALLMIVCIARSFMPFPLERRGYVGSMVAVVIGTTILMAMWPSDFVKYTDALGIGHRQAPDLALSGGVIGSQLAAPETKYIPAGFIRRGIGSIGTIVVAMCLLVPGLVFIFLADWKPVIVQLLLSGDGKSPGRLDLRKLDSQKGKGQDGGGSVEDVSPDVEIEPPPKVEIRRPSEDDEAVSEEKGAKTPSPPPAPIVDGMHPDDKAEDSPKDKPARKAQPAASHHRSRSSMENPDYILPPVSLLDKGKETKGEDSGHIEESQRILQSTLESFNIDGRVSGIIVGPRVTRFEVSLSPGVKVEKVTGITNNISMDLKAESIRILAPIPGKDAVGVEVPNKVSSNVYIRSVMDSSAWKESHDDIPIILGRDVAGKAIIANLAKAPHLLIAGSTGSGKSVCMNTLIMSLLFKFPPSDMRLILVDPKHVELEMYRPLPHLITPVVNDPKKVPLALRWAVNEMERRYKMLAKVKAKNLSGFNSRAIPPEPVLDENGEAIPKKMPLLIVIIDELADIMMTDARSDVETSICRIAQKGRAAGIHLVIATQTPRKDIITGVIKANLPTKIAFKVTSGIDSRVILDGNGAETLLGKGDMLFRPPGGDSLERIQGAMVSDAEIQKVVDFVSGQIEQDFDTKVLSEAQVEGADGEDGEGEEDGELPANLSSEFADSIAAKYLQPGDGDLIRKALEIVLAEGKASTSYLQRRLTIGYNKSAELMDALEKRGIVSAPLPGGQKREILVFDELEKKD